MAERSTASPAHAASTQGGGAQQENQADASHHATVADALLQRMLVDRAPDWNGVDPVPPGNELWVRRPEGYNHSGVYIGNGWVVNLDGSPMTHMGRMLTHARSWATVIKSSVATFAEGGTVKPGPTKATHPPETVIADALSWVGKVRNYNPLTDNCQHFSSMLVSGVAYSPEAETIKLLALQAESAMSRIP